MTLLSITKEKREVITLEAFIAIVNPIAAPLDICLIHHIDDVL